VRYEALTLALVVTGVGQAVYDDLVDTPGGQPDRFCPLVPGDIAWDACDCGLLAQTITSAFGSNNFPQPAADSRQTRCGPNLTVAQVTLVLVRCVTTFEPNSDGTRPPTCAQLLADAVTLEYDRWTVRRAVSCYLGGLRDATRIHDFAVGPVASVGPSGGCVGVQLTYQFAVGSVCC